ncbi:S-adenosylmethionine decarboxylase family protein [uncultured Cytophaga sp.]|uniref:S-adenosylmethionine decarboxylase family protein n=1 Tax=uncultured Cytophaga sp. TaxID=160238 RepID=UPI002628D3D9|nr:S-adenosylmethionine decarboxylase [uncultured Cytophaga sp.]
MFNKDGYAPGLHVLGTIHTNEVVLLSDYSPFKQWITEKIISYTLTPLGEFYHAFDGAGYTGMICLTESHIAFHSWPEYNLITIDIFLSNFKQENDAKARGLFDACVHYFKATSVDKNEVKR